MRAKSERLAPPLVVLADNFPHPAHNQSMNTEHSLGLSLTGVPSDRSSSLGWLTTDHCSLTTVPSQAKNATKFYPIFAFLADYQIQ
jgi:hypothetical protein